MTVWAATFFVIGLIAAGFAWGAGGSTTLAGVASVLAAIFIGLAFVTLVLHWLG